MISSEGTQEFTTEVLYGIPYLRIWGAGTGYMKPDTLILRGVPPAEGTVPLPWKLPPTLATRSLAISHMLQAGLGDLAWL